jgi:hypothetical protein
MCSQACMYTGMYVHIHMHTYTYTGATFDIPFSDLSMDSLVQDEEQFIDEMCQLLADLGTSTHPHIHLCKMWYTQHAVYRSIVFSMLTDMFTYVSYFHGCAHGHAEESTSIHTHTHIHMYKYTRLMCWKLQGQSQGHHINLGSGICSFAFMFNLVAECAQRQRTETSHCFWIWSRTSSRCENNCRDDGFICMYKYYEMTMNDENEDMFMYTCI